MKNGLLPGHVHLGSVSLEYKFLKVYKMALQRETEDN